MHWDPSTLQTLSKSRADQFMREAEEWRAAILAVRSLPDSRGGLARALAWWRSHLPRRRAERAPMVEPEQS